LKISHPWLTFKCGEGHFISKSESVLGVFFLVFCDLLYHHNLYDSFASIGTPGCIGRGLHFSCTRHPDLFIGLYHTYPHSTFHKSGINIISIFFQHSFIATTITSVLSFQHIIFFKEIPSVFNSSRAVLRFSLVLNLSSHFVHYFCYILRRSMSFGRIIQTSIGKRLCGVPVRTSRKGGVCVKGSLFIS
jgi:hypothetical protein